jgi:hypothetical protein
LLHAARLAELLKKDETNPITIRFRALYTGLIGRWTNAATQVLQAESVPAPKSPIVGNLAGCCTRAASGHPAAPPSSVMKSRRPTQNVI